MLLQKAPGSEADGQVCSWALEAQTGIMAPYRNRLAQAIPSSVSDSSTTISERPAMEIDLAL